MKKRIIRQINEKKNRSGRKKAYGRKRKKRKIRK